MASVSQKYMSFIRRPMKENKHNDYFRICMLSLGKYFKFPTYKGSIFYEGPKVYILRDTRNKQRGKI